MMRMCKTCLLTSTIPMSHTAPDLSLSAPSSPASSGPQLPVEVCERIIDFVAGMNLHFILWGDHEMRSALRACALTCRSWVPRSRFHLFESITVRSSSDLDAIVGRLRASPVLWDRVEELIIDVRTVPAPHWWMFCLPVRLAPMLRKLRWLTFDSIDLSIPHENFYKGLLLWRGIENLHLTDVQYTQHSQLARLISALDSEDVCISHRPGCHLSSENCRIPRGGQFRPTVRCVSLRYLYLKLPWKKIRRIVGDLTFPQTAIRLPSRFILRCTDLIWTKAGTSHRLVDMRHSLDALFRQLRSHRRYDGDFYLTFRAKQCYFILEILRTP